MRLSKIVAMEKTRLYVEAQEEAEVKAKELWGWTNNIDGWLGFERMLTKRIYKRKHGARFKSA